MSTTDGASSRRASTQSANTESPIGPLGGLELEAEQIGAAMADPGAPQTKVRRRYLVPLVAAYFALYVAWITPIGFTLAIRVQQIDPEGKNTALALAVGIPGVIVVITSPLAGVLSDRTLSRFGRRRPWFFGGAMLGLIGSAMVGLAPSVAVVVIGWSIAYIGYSICGAMILTHLSDLLPEQQRGKVAGIAGAVTQIGPIVGIVFAGAFVAIPFVMFAAPAAFAFVIGIVFVALMKDKPITQRPGPVDVKGLLRGFYFNPRRYPNLGWVWISRAFIFVALSFSTTYGVYLLGSRLGLAPAAIAGVAATVGGLSIIVAIGGAVLSGFLSDRLHSRKPFLIASAIVLAAGMIVVATLTSATQYIVGGLLTSFAIGVYGAVDQAVQLDVLPHGENQNGRYLGIIQLANQVPQAVGPLLAGGLIALAAGNYTIVYIAGAVVSVLGALAIIPISIGRRALDSTTSISLPNSRGN